MLSSDAWQNLTLSANQQLFLHVSAVFHHMLMNQYLVGVAQQEGSGQATNRSWQLATSCAKFPPFYMNAVCLLTMITLSSQYSHHMFHLVSHCLTSQPSCLSQRKQKTLAKESVAFVAERTRGLSWFALEVWIRIVSGLTKTPF